jgi:hypothetical protein
MSKVRVARCGRYRSTGAGLLLVVLAAPALAQDTPADVEAACTAGSNLPAALCACIGERSADELSADQRSFYVATLNGNDSETTRLRGSMDATALIGAVTFLRTAPAACAG